MNYSAAGMTSTSWLGSWNGNTLQAIAPSVLNVGSATKLQTARSIFGKSFNGTADIAGKPLVYGSYTSTANARYANSGIEVRENGLVGSAQSDIGYAPAIGFHWSGRIAATFLFHSDGTFYLRQQDGTSRATLDANLNGNCYGTANYATNAYFLYPKSDIVYGRNNLQYFNASLSTTASATANYAPTADWYHIIRMNHGNNGGYYVDLAACFHTDNFYIKRVTNGTNNGYKHIWVEGNSVTGAVWNDYAEYRESDCQEFGRVLVENGDDSLSISNFRLQPFAGVSSDTWGFCQGETEKAKTPIAVAGRVLVYPYQDRENYKPGDCVCAAPNGTVDIMTRQEVIQYPDRIVGTVSCIPDYEEWGQGDRPAVKVDGRIWIKVR